MTLRWKDIGHGWWDGMSGSFVAATVYDTADSRAWRWRLLDDAAEGEADTPDAARAAAETAWAEWCASAGVAAVGWRPIETAPRDGSEILVTDGRRVWVSRWGPRYGGPVTWELVDFAYDPTHWLLVPPLPPPPVAPEEEGWCRATKRAAEGDAP